ncbi:hypothetical protein ACIKT0_05505 [Hansschlegelia beijingensis]|uniref:capsular polysaccharide export protein, LipB/KpsS family n=1 Tax=Hansschlegelia beijingensis TaxID=1133344 RepID=UPI00387F2231
MDAWSAQDGAFPPPAMPGPDALRPQPVRRDPVAAAPARRSRASAVVRARLESGALALMKAKDFGAAERRIVRLALTGPISDICYMEYIQKVVYPRHATRIRDLASSNHMGVFQSRMTKAFVLAGQGDVAGAQDQLHELLKATGPNADVWRAVWFICRYGGMVEASVDAGRRYLELTPGVKFRFAKGLALVAERIGKFGVMKFALKRAIKDAKECERQPKLFKREYVRLARFWLDVYDLDRAERVLALARKRKLSGVDDLAEMLALVRQETAGWLDHVEAARLDLQRRIRGVKLPTPPDAVEVVLSSAALTFKPDENRLFRSTLRFAQGEILAAARATGRPIRIRSKLDSQTVVPGRKGRCLLSYHTQDEPGLSMHFKEAYHPGYITLDPKGYAGWCSVAELGLEDLNLGAINLEKAEAFFQERAGTLIARNISKYEQPDAVRQELPTPYVFVGLQIINDSVQRLAYVPMLDMLQEVSEYCRANGMNLVVKRHPLCTSPAVAERLKTGERTGEFIVSSASVHDLIRGATAVCVVNSGVGFEALFHMKPVYLFGKSDYRHACFEVRRAGDFASMFRGELPLLPSATLKRYIYWIHHSHFIDCSDRITAGAEIRARVLEYIGSKKSVNFFGSLRRAFASRFF